MQKFILAGDFLINPDHVATVENKRNGKLIIRLAIPDPEGHYILELDDSDKEIWAKFIYRPKDKPSN